MRWTILTVVIVTVFLLLTEEVQAQQVEVPVAYGISSAPFASSSYSRGVTQLKLQGEYFTVSGNNADLAGGGIDGVVRSSLTDLEAVSVQFGLFGMRGSSDDIVLAGGTSVASHSDISLGELLVGVNGELQVFHRKGMSVILLAGPLAEMFYGTIDATFGSPVPLSGLSDSGDVMNVLYGLQGGGQLGLEIAAFRVSMFALLQNLQGTSRIMWSEAGKETAEVHPATATTAGIELAYPAWDISLGAQMQTRPGRDNMRGYRTTLYHLSWLF